MEKEITFELENFNINFFYEDFELDTQKLEEFNVSIKKLLKGLDAFVGAEKTLKDFFWTLNINLCNDETIIQLNSDHRSKNKITDVLSFPLQEDIRNDEFDKFLPEIELGDIYICHSVCLKQSKEFDISYQDEFIHLAVHGFLHLMGYDHEISLDEEKLMESLEEKIIKSISQ